MGTWGAGLYSGDLALDLRETVRAVARLPFDGTRILEILRDTNPEAADNPTNEEHTVFWLVVADQLHKRGIECAGATRKAIDIIESGSDEAIFSSLGMPASHLRKRAKTLAALRDQLSAPLPARRKLLRSPQPLTLEVDAVYAFPTSKGKVWNPYVNPSPQRRPEWYKWTRDGWGAMLVVDRGLAFDYLAWYRITVCQREFDEKPVVEALWEAPWMSGGYGTCSPVEFTRMGLDRIGEVLVDRAAFEAAFGSIGVGLFAAAGDITIANHLHVVSKHENGLGNFYPEHQHTVPLREFASPTR